MSRSTYPIDEYDHQIEDFLGDLEVYLVSGLILAPLGLNLSRPALLWE